MPSFWSINCTSSLYKDFASNHCPPSLPGTQISDFSRRPPYHPPETGDLFAYFSSCFTVTHLSKVNCETSQMLTSSNPESCVPGNSDRLCSYDDITPGGEDSVDSQFLQNTFQGAGDNTGSTVFVIGLHESCSSDWTMGGSSALSIPSVLPSRHHPPAGVEEEGEGRALSCSPGGPEVVVDPSTSQLQQTGHMPPLLSIF